MAWRLAGTSYGGAAGPPGPPGPAGGSLAMREFTYVADGTEGADFPIPIVPDLADANYGASVTGGGITGTRAFDVVLADNAVNSIHVIATAPLTAGDVLVVAITELS